MATTPRRPQVDSLAECAHPCLLYTCELYYRISRTAQFHCKAPIAGAVTDSSKESVENSLEAELPRVRAKRLKRAEKYQYVGNEEFEEEVICFVLPSHVCTITVSINHLALS